MRLACAADPLIAGLEDANLKLRLLGHLILEEIFLAHEMS